MSQSIKLLTDEAAVHWPQLCARCGATGRLRSAETLVAATRSTRPDMRVKVPAGSDTLAVAYPVCKRHARFLTLAHWLTRNTKGSRLLRGAIYALAGASLLALSVLALRAMGSESPGLWESTTAPLLSVELVLLLLPMLVVWAYRATPVRLSRLENDAVTVSFGFAPYFEAFVEANSKIVVRRRANPR